MQKLKYVTLITLVVVFNLGLPASAQVAFIDIIPGCEIEITESRAFELKQILRQDENIESHRQALENRLINQARDYFSELGTASNLAGFYLSAVQKEERQIESIRRAENNPLIEATYRFEFIGVYECEVDTPELRTPAPYNRSGERVFKDTSLTIGVAQQWELQPPAQQELELKSHIISLEEGFYGRKIGDSISALYRSFTPPDSVLRLQGNASLLGFGRHHWVWIQNEEIRQISHHNPYFTPYALYLIPDQHALDKIQWSWRNQCTKGVTCQLEAPVATDNQVLSLIQSPRGQLQGITLQAPNFSPPPMHFLTPGQIEDLLTDLAPALREDHAMQNPQFDFQTVSHTQLEGGRAMYWMSPNLTLTLGQSAVRKIEIEQVLLESQPQTSIVSVPEWLERLGLPSTVGAWESEIPEVFAFNGEISHFGNYYAIKIQFDERDANRPITRMVIEFM